MEESFKKEKKLLEIELEQDKRMIKQLELRVDIGRKTVQEAKAAQAQAERDLSQVCFIILSSFKANVFSQEKLSDLLLVENQNGTKGAVTD